jgi:Fic/DOC family
MADPNTRTFSLNDQPEVFATSTETSAAVRRAVDAGRARKVAGRLYTRDTDSPLETVARRNWTRIAAHHFPEAVVVDRSAFEARPSEDGSLFLDAGPPYTGRRPVRLPGLTLRPRRGPGAVSGDMPHMDGLHFSSRARALLDNLRPSRARDGIARTLTPAELENELTRTAALRGNDALNEFRDQARVLAGQLHAEAELERLDDLIGSILGTRDVPLATAAARASHAGTGFDSRRVELFEALQAALLRESLPVRGAQPGSFPALSFIEAYLSNWIEGTEFPLDEAEEIVFERVMPEGRLEDAHDVIGTFELVNDPARRRRLPADADELIDLLRAHHATILERRPQVGPGAFKTRENQAGGTVFVHPDLVIGTLMEGFRFYAALPAGLGQAIFLMFLVSEVHPFADGNGRVGRVLMNAALSAVDEQRIVIPLVYRDEYLQSLRALSRGGDPRPLIRVLDYAQEYAAAIEWRDLGLAERMLEKTNALVPPDVAEEQGLRLKMPE